MNSHMHLAAEIPFMSSQSESTSSMPFITHSPVWISRVQCWCYPCHLGAPCIQCHAGWCWRCHCPPLSLRYLQCMSQVLSLKSRILGAREGLWGLCVSLWDLLSYIPSQVYSIHGMDTSNASMNPYCILQLRTTSTEELNTDVDILLCQLRQYGEREDNSNNVNPWIKS